MAKEATIKVVYSPLDALQIAQGNPEKRVCFVGVGFETTSPTVASTLLLARNKGVKNLYIYPGFKLIPPAMGFLSEREEARIDGFICPGHVSTIIGSYPYEFIPRRFGIPCVITGFEPLDILQGIWMLLRQKRANDPKVEIQYKRGVNQDGNPQALASIKRVFQIGDSQWRGIGEIPSSGLGLSEKFADYDAKKAFDLHPPRAEEPSPPDHCIKIGEVNGVGRENGVDCGPAKSRLVNDSRVPRQLIYRMTQDLGNCLFLAGEE